MRLFIQNSEQLILLDGDDDSNPTEQSDMLNKSNTDNEMPERRRYGSIKKILSNQPLEKQEYVGEYLHDGIDRYY